MGLIDAFIERQILDLHLIDEYYDGLRVSTAATSRNKLWFYDRLQEQWDAGVDIAMYDTRSASQVQNVPRLLTVEQARQQFGFVIDRSKGWDTAAPGSWGWKLVALCARTGPAQAINKVLDGSGHQIEGILGLASWPDGGPPHNVNDQPVYPDYTIGGYYAAGFSNADGDFPVTMGPEGHIGGSPPAGAFSMWYSNSPANALDYPAQWADALTKVGWMAEVDHFTVAGIWQIRQKTGDTPGPQPPVIIPPGDDVHVVEVAVDGQVVSTVKFKVTTQLTVVE